MIKMNVHQSIHIDAAPAKIFTVINDLHQWERWSPWVIAEPTAEITVAKDGKYHEWDGKIIGSGNLKIIEEMENQLVEMQLNFLKPWKSTATTCFELEATKKGTLVHWKMNSSLPLFLFWMKKQMQVFVGMDYDRGLLLLKDLVENGKAHSQLDIQGTTHFPATNYIGITTQCSTKEIGENMERDFTALMAFVMKECQDIMNGDALSIYHKFNVMRGRVKYTACFPVTAVPEKLPEGFISGRVPDLTTYSIRHTGPYHHIANAWAAGMMHQRGKQFKPAKSFPPFEVMRNSPKNTPPNALISDILFPMKG